MVLEEVLGLKDPHGHSTFGGGHSAGILCLSLSTSTPSRYETEEGLP